MNLPNKLTIARTILVPLFLALLLIPGIPYHYVLACAVFSAASLTDYFDGKIARKRNIVTTFGKFLDPLADKILVTGALIAFVQIGLAHSVAVILIVARDFMVSGVRMLAVSAEGKVIAANWWGKIKTALQMIVIIAVLLACQLTAGSEGAFAVVALWSNIAIWALAVYTMVSGFIYVAQNKQLINTFD